MACRLPGADDLDQFWDLIHRAGVACGPLPASRLNRELYYHPDRGVSGKTYSDVGGLVSSRPFDGNSCPLPDKLIAQSDDAHLTVCEVAAAAVRDAGYDPFHFPLPNCGVYIGHTGGSPWVSDLVYSTIVEEGAQSLAQTDYFRQLGSAGQELIAQIVRRVRREYPGRRKREHLSFVESGASAAAGLITKAFDLTGPYMVVDAACASSLQAMAVGIRSLLQGRIDAALVGGASYCKSDSLVLFSAAQSVSAHQSCPFGAQADGLITAEGYVVLLLKTLERALADGDRIRAVIRGLGVSSDGKGRSLWAPRMEGQILAMQRAYGPGVDAGRVQYIEAHATSTQVGDATELQALSTVLKQLLPASAKKIPVGSVKGNVGHTLETAGMAGLVKAVLSMEHGVIPPNVGDGQLNKELDWSQCPFYVPFREEPWPEFADGHPRRTAVNAFGIGGLNVHVVLDEYQPARSPTRVTPPGSTPAASTRSAEAADDRAVAIVGAGCILPGAHTLAAFWDLLDSGRDALSTPTPQRWNVAAYQSDQPEPFRTYSALGGFICGYEYDWKRHKVPPKQVAAANPLQFMLLDAADQALRDAGLHDSPYDTQRVGVVVGTVFGGDFANQLQMGLRLPEFNVVLRETLLARGVAEDAIGKTAEQFRELLLDKMPALIDETGSFTSSTLASRITKTFNLMGGALALDAGGCSSAFAIQAAVDMLNERQNDLVLCACGQRSMDLWVYETLSLAGVLSRGRPRAPLDADADGFVPGEGCAVLVLKRLSDARRDGDRVHAVIRGIGAATGSGSRQAIAAAARAALREAKLAPNSVGALELASLGVTAGDAGELAALEEVYGNGQGGPQLALGSLQPQLGDLAGANMAAGILKASFCLQHGEIVPTAGFSKPAPALEQRADRFFVPQSRQPLPAGSPQGYQAMALSSLQEKMAFHVILDNGKSPAELSSSVPAPAEATAETTWRIFRFGATNLRELQRLLAEAASDPARAAAAEDPLAFSLHDRFRLAVVADSPTRLVQRLQLTLSTLARDGIPHTFEEQGIFFAEVPLARPKIAVLFPGQGSQYTGMLREISARQRAANKSWHKVNAAAARLGYQLFDDLAWREPNRLGTDLWSTQAAMLMADWICFSALGELGVQPDLIAGHSFGEFPALAAAGAWSLKEALKATRSRCAAVAQCGQASSAMLSVQAARPDVERALAERPDEVWLCADNGPDQTVVGGSEVAVTRFAERAAQLNWKSRRLSVPCAFHTPLLRASQAALGAALSKRNIGPPAIPFVSSTTASFVADPHELRAALVKQMVSPVRFTETVQRLRSAGAEVYLEAGPGQVLTQLTRRILSDQPPLLCMGLDNARAGCEQLARLRAALEVVRAVAPPKPKADSVTIRSAVVQAAASQPTAREPASQAAASLPAETPKAEQSTHTIRFFDATLRRRERQRQAAMSGAAKLPPPAERSQPKAAASRASSEAVSGNGAHPHRSAGESRDAELLAWLVELVRDNARQPREKITEKSEWQMAVTSPGVLLEELREYFELSPQDLSKLAQARSVSDLASLLPGKSGKGAWLPPAKAPPGNASAVKSPQIAAVTPIADVPAPIRALSSSAPALNTHTASDDWESFLVGFVVEQTGYPAEMVELDADLEADLGIDSIKKAQLFGELGERFQLQADSNLSLDDFPTLRHVLSYLQQRTGKPRGDASRPDPAPSEPVAVMSQALQPGPAAVAELEPTAIAILEPPAGEAASDLSAFLVNFVVEQTGYPAEMVELDAGLEADLGIDSIKKAQLFGELGERFQIAADPDLSLDDFPTLRHVLNYLAARVSPAVSQPASLPSPAAPTPKARFNAEASAVAAPDATTPFDKGFRQGRAAAAAISARLRRRASQMDAAAASEAVSGLEVLQQLSDDERRELEGIADGAGVLVESLQGLVIDEAAGRLEQEVAFELNPASPHRVTIDLRCGRLEPALVVHHAANGRRSCTVRFPGQLGAAAGINDAGVVVAYRSPSAHSPADPRRVSPALIVQRILDQADCASAAVELIQHSGWLTNSTLVVAQLSGDGVAELNCTEAGVAVSPRKRPATNSAPSSANGQQRERQQVDFGDREVVLHTASGASSVTFEARVRSEPWLDRCVSPPAPTPAAHKENVTSRYVIRLTPAARCAPVSRLAALEGHTLIYGAGPLASAVSQRLAAGGGRATILAPSSDLNSLLARVDRLLATDLPQHLMLLSGCEPPDIATPTAWRQLQASMLLGPFQLAQRWVGAVTKANQAAQATLTAVSALGGDFGLGCQNVCISGGALAGLAKGIRTEHPALAVRVVDVDARLDPHRAADALVQEIESRDGELEVALTPDDRRVVRHALLPAVQSVGVAPPAAGDTWIVTGGARGVTAVVARELGRRFGLRLHLLGTTAPAGIDPAWLDMSAQALQSVRTETLLSARAQGQDPLAVWNHLEKSLEIARTLRTLREAGCQATYHACDISDWTALDSTLTKICTVSGPISGILHGAGYELAAKLEKKKLEHVERTISAKAEGAAALMALTERDPVRFFLAFGSISGRFGGMGQADYSLANELLAKQVDEWRGRHPHARATTFHWHAWDEVGMAARPESRFALEGFGMQLMPTAEGTAHVLEELAAGLPEPEVIFAQPRFCPRTIDAATPLAPAPAPAPTTEAPRASLQSPAPSSSDEEWVPFLIDFVVEQTGYPPEMVDLDADLEGDLGIDSIKKAQLFGEIGERLKLQPSRDLSLDDFPTLRHVLNYLKSLPIAGRPVSQPPPVIAAAAPAAAGTAPVARDQAANQGATRAATLGPVSLIDGQVTKEHGSYWALAQLDAGRDVFLLDHKLRGRPILPAVVGLELMAQAARTVCGAESASLRLTNFNVHQALRFQDDEQRTVRVNVRPSGQGWSASIVSDLVNLKGQVVERDRLLMSADVEFAAGQEPVEPFRDAPLPYFPWPYNDDAPMYHGPSLRCLKETFCQHDGGWARLIAPEGNELGGPRSSGWITPSALIDACFVGCGIFDLVMFELRIDIPQGFERLDVLRQPRPGERCNSRFKFLRITPENAWFNFVLYGEDRTPILRAHEYRTIFFHKVPLG
jgi:acyl transferase domain-containing protein